MDLRKLKTILDLFENSAIQELEITEGEEKLRLVKNSQQQSSQSLAYVPSSSSMSQELSLPPDTIRKSVPEEEDARLVQVESPMVGTYYEKAGTDEPPFVKVGEHVNEGDVVCIIEAMKLFNNVNAPVSGKIRSIAMENEQPVGFGELLMTIEKDD